MSEFYFYMYIMQNRNSIILYIDKLYGKEIEYYDLQ